MATGEPEVSSVTQHHCYSTCSLRHEIHANARYMQYSSASQKHILRRVIQCFTYLVKIQANSKMFCQTVTVYLSVLFNNPSLLTYNCTEPDSPVFTKRLLIKKTLGNLSGLFLCLKCGSTTLKLFVPEVEPVLNKYFSELQLMNPSFLRLCLSWLQCLIQEGLYPELT